MPESLEVLKRRRDLAFEELTKVQDRMPVWPTREQFHEEYMAHERAIAAQWHYTWAKNWSENARKFT